MAVGVAGLWHRAVQACRDSSSTPRSGGAGPPAWTLAVRRSKILDNSLECTWLSGLSQDVTTLPGTLTVAHAYMKASLGNGGQCRPLWGKTAVWGPRAGACVCVLSRVTGPRGQGGS